MTETAERLRVVSTPALPHGRVPPHNLDAEKSLLALIFEEPDKIKSLGTLSTTHFYRDSHRIVFGAMLRCVQDGVAPDMAALREHLSAEELALAGGDEYLESVRLCTATASNAAYYAKIIIAKAKARSLIQVAASVAQLGYEQHDVDAYASEAQERIAAVNEEYAAPESSSIAMGAADFLDSCNSTVEYLAEYIPRGGFVEVLGAPKHGKTWWLGWLAATVASSGKRVVFVEQEGSREVLGDRLRPFMQPDPARFNSNLRILFRKGFRVDDAASLESLILECKGADLLIADPFYGLHTQDENDTSGMCVVVNGIQRLISETGAAVVVAQHPRKGESWQKGGKLTAESADSRGSGALVGAVDNIIHIRSVSASERRVGQVRFFVENPDTRVGAPLPKRLATIDLAAGTLTYSEDFEGPGEKQGEATEALLERALIIMRESPRPIGQEKLRKVLNCGTERLAAALSLGRARGTVDTNSSGSRAINTPNSRPDSEGQ